MVTSWIDPFSCLSFECFTPVGRAGHLNRKWMKVGQSKNLFVNRLNNGSFLQFLIGTGSSYVHVHSFECIRVNFQSCDIFVNEKFKN